jgi:hypothetical protein
MWNGVASLIEHSDGVALGTSYSMITIEWNLHLMDRHCKSMK